MSAIRLVTHNPFRVLGVYANSPKKDILANKGRATAFLRVGKSVEYPLDLNGILPTIGRTIEMFNDAEAKLAIAKEQVKYAQFWFLKITPIDDVAFNHLTNGNMVVAKDMWSKQDSLSSLQNRMICCLIENNTESALMMAEKLYNHFGNDYVKTIDANCTLQMTGTELLHQFVDALSAEVDMQSFLNCGLGAETKEYLGSKVVGPLISKITAEIDKAKNVDHGKPTARKEAGQKLMTATKEPLQQLKNILHADNPQYQMIADKLGIEILQCGIDYFNNSEDDDAPQTAMKLQKYAQSIVVGGLAKDRCNENVNILEEIIKDLPPTQVIAEDKAIKSELEKYVRLPDKISYAITLLNNTKAHLQIIKQKLGSSNAYYLKISTRVVSNAVHNLVEEVNVAQEPLIRFNKLVENMDSYMVRSLLNTEIGDKYEEARSSLKSVLRKAWEATCIMDDFDLEADYQSHYNKNKSSLKSMCEKIGISTYVREPTTPTTPRPAPTTPPTPAPNDTGKETNVGCIIAIVLIIVLGIIGNVVNGGEGLAVGIFVGALFGAVTYFGLRN